MSQQDRREFIKKLAKGTAYVAPVVHSLAAPLDLVGQGKSSEHKREWPQTAGPVQEKMQTSPFPPPP
jgi:hypothetical protein